MNHSSPEAARRVRDALLDIAQAHYDHAFNAMLEAVRTETQVENALSLVGEHSHACHMVRQLHLRAKTQRRQAALLEATYANAAHAAEYIQDDLDEEDSRA